MSQVGNINVNIGANLSGLKTGINQATNLTNGLAQHMNNLKLNLDITQALTNITNINNQIHNISNNNTIININTTQAQAKVKSLADKIEDISKKMMTVGSGIALGGGGIITKGITEYAKQDDKMKFIETLNTDWNNMSSADQKAYEDKYKQMANQISMKVGTDTSQVMDSMYNVLSSGIEEKDVAQFSELIAKGGKVGKVQDTGELAKNLKMMAMGFGKENDMGTYQAFMDKLLTMQNLGIMNVGQAGSLGKIVNQWGRSGLDANTLFATMSGMSFYQSADQATDDINGFLRAVNNPNKQQMKYANMKGIDISAKSLQDKGLSQYLKDIKSLGLSDGELAKLFGTDEAKRFAINMMSNIDMVDKFTEQMKSSGGTTDNMWKTMEGSASTQLDRLKVSIGQMWAGIGEAVAPHIMSIANAVEGLISWFQGLSDTTKSVLGTMLFWVTVGGLVIAIIGGIIWVVTSLYTTVMTVIGGVKLLIGWFKGLSTASLAMTGKIILIVAVVLAIAYAIWFLSNNWEGSWATIKGVTEGVVAGILGVLGILALGIQKVLELIDQLSTTNNVIRIAGKIIGDDDLANFKGLTGHMADGVGVGVNWLTDQAISLNNSSHDNMDIAKKTDWKVNPFAGLSDDVNKATEGIKVNPVEVPTNIVNENPSNAMDMGGINDLNQQLKDYGKQSEDATKKAKEEADKMASAINKIKDSIKSLSKSFQEKINVFDGFSKKLVNTTTLLAKAKERANAFGEWKQAQDLLANRAELSADVKGQIQNMGVDQLGELQALTRMSNEQLKQWNAYNAQVASTSLAQASNTTVTNNINVSVQDQNIKAIAQQIYQELKKQGAI